MTAIICNSDATVKAVNLEDYILKLVRFGIANQKDINKNPNELDNLSLSIDSEEILQGQPSATNGGVASISITGLSLRSVDRATFLSPASLVAVDYLSGITYTAGTGGTPTFPSNIWVQSLVDAVRLAAALQNVTAKNPSGVVLVSSWDIKNGASGALTDATFSAELKIPLIATETTDGQATKAAEALGDL